MAFQYVIRQQLHAFQQANVEEMRADNLRYLLNLYTTKEDDNPQAKIAFYQGLLDVVKADIHHFSSQRSIWQSIKAFFGFMPTHHQSYYSLAKEIGGKLNQARKAQNQYWMPSDWLYWASFKLNGYQPFKADAAPHISEEQAAQNPLTYAAFRLMGNKAFTNNAFQGKNPSVATVELIEDIDGVLQDFAHLPQQDIAKLQQLKTSLQFSYHLYNQLTLSQTLYHYDESEDKIAHEQDRIRDITAAIQHRIASLQPGEHCTIPGGFGAIGSGHATLIEITKCPTGNNFYFRHYNTGAGEVYTYQAGQKPAEDSIEEKLVPIKQATVTANTLFATDLIYRLTHLLYATPTMESKDAESAMKAALSSLQFEQTDVQIPLQSNGTCAHSCLMSWLYTRLSSLSWQAMNTWQNHHALDVLHKIKPKQPTTMQPDLQELQTHGQMLLAKRQVALSVTLDQNRTIYQTSYDTLASLLRKKGKRLNKKLPNLQRYYDKKMANPKKLNTNDRNYIETGKKPNNQYKPSSRAEKARLARNLLLFPYNAQLEPEIKQICKMS